MTVAWILDIPDFIHANFLFFAPNLLPKRMRIRNGLEQ